MPLRIFSLMHNKDFPPNNGAVGTPCTQRSSVSRSEDARMLEMTGLGTPAKDSCMLGVEPVQERLHELQVAELQG